MLQGEIADLPDLLALRALAEHPGRPLRFDAIVGHNALIDAPDRAAAIALLADALAPGGVASLAERIPRHTQRLHSLANLSELGEELAGRVVAAEEAIYSAAEDTLVNWDAPDLAAAWQQAEGGGLTVEWETEDETTEIRVTAGLLDRWFAPAGDGRPSYRQRLAALLSDEEIAQVEALYRRQFLNQVVPWRSRTVYVKGAPGSIVCFRRNFPHARDQPVFRDKHNDVLQRPFTASFSRKIWRAKGNRNHRAAYASCRQPIATSIWYGHGMGSDVQA